MYEQAIDAVRDFIGHAYIETPTCGFKGECSERVRGLFRTISRVNDALFERIPFEVDFVETDPYESAADMRRQVYATGRIAIYTVSGGHPVLTHEQNNISRAVHDVFAHMVCGCPFTFQGEYNAYLTQRENYPVETWPLLFSEIPAQTAAFYAAGKQFNYPQRAFEAPQAWLELCERVGTRREYQAANKSLLEYLCDIDLAA